MSTLVWPWPHPSLVDSCCLIQLPVKELSRSQEWHSEVLPPGWDSASSQISLENFGILPASRWPFKIYLQEMMCHAESGAAVRDTVAGTCVLCRRLSRDTLQTVEDALSLQLRESWPLPSPCPFELESERKGRGKGKRRPPTVSSTESWVPWWVFLFILSSLPP